MPAEFAFFADNNVPVHVYLIQRLRHCLRGSFIGCIAPPQPHPATSGQGRGFSRTHQIKPYIAGQ
jgi:hypothetical protein